MSKLTSVSIFVPFALLHTAYSDHTGLRDHFDSQHFLCEEGDCKENIFSAVFRTDIDLKGKNET